MITKSVLLKAENNYGVDVVLEVQESVEKMGITRAYENYQYSEQYDHIKCLDYLYPADEFASGSFY
jgi:ABC-type sulfate transport system substrate-binding protein